MIQVFYEKIIGVDTNDWDVSYKREFLQCEDEGEIILDWAFPNIDHNDDEYKGFPVLVLFPGLTGTSDDTYILNAIREAHQQGFVVVVCNH